MKRFFLYLLEIIIWLIVIYFIAQVTIRVFYPQVKEYKEYTLKMNDIDGLIVGSPVRLMGMLVGSVSKIDYKEEEVLLTIRITKKDINLPEKTTLSIEGASLGGNRSIELTPSGDKLGISVKTPERMIDMMKSANSAMEDMIKGYVEMLAIVNSRTPDELDEKMVFFNNQLTAFDSLSIKVNDAIVKRLEMQPEQLKNINAGMTTMVQSSSNPEIKQSIQNFDKCLDSIQTQTKCLCEQTKGLSAQKLNERCDEINRQSRALKSGQIKAQKAKNTLDSINSAAEGINNFANMLENFSKNLKKNKSKKEQP